MATTILIVDDEPVQRRLLEAHVNRMGYRALMAGDGEEALDVLASARGKHVDLIILDLVMPGLDGMGTLGALKKQSSPPPVIVQTAQGGIDIVVSAMRAGAVDFCVKPVSFERLKVSIANALKLGAMEKAVLRTTRTQEGAFTFADMIAESAEMERALRLAKRAADSNIPVLIEGESGVGKEVIARAIQGESARARKPFITVNCGALPENLAESILFGHEKGAFTGADRAHEGKFKQADGGTLFLDEVGELTADLQVKLLRAIQEGEIDPVGARQPVKTDFRLISATNRDMIEMVKDGQFREDLFYRLNVFPLTLPPLRRRKSDIEALVRHFIARIALEEGRTTITGIDREALSALEAHDWPGNIRQLENMIFRAVILCEGTELTLDEFPQLGAGTGPRRVGQPDGREPAAALAKDGTFVAAIDDAGEPRALDAVEEEMIRLTIAHHKGRMTRVAASLGIGRSTLYRKLKEYGISAEPSDRDAAA